MCRKLVQAIMGRRTGRGSLWYITQIQHTHSLYLYLLSYMLHIYNIVTVHYALITVCKSYLFYLPKNLPISVTFFYFRPIYIYISSYQDFCYYSFVTNIDNIPLLRATPM